MDEDDCSTCSTVSSLSFSMHVGSICVEKPNKRRRLSASVSNNTTASDELHPVSLLQPQRFVIPNPIAGPVHVPPAASTVDRSSSGKRRRGTNYCRIEIKGLLDTIEKIKPKDQSQWDIVQNIHQSKWPDRDRPASSLRKKFREICNSDLDTDHVASGISKVSKTDILRARNMKNSLDNSIWRKLALLKNELDAAKKVKHSVSFRAQPSLLSVEKTTDTSTSDKEEMRGQGGVTNGLTRSCTLPRTRAFIDLTTINIPLNVPNPLSNIVDVPPVIQILISPSGQSNYGDLDDVSELGLDDDQDNDALEDELKHPTTVLGVSPLRQNNLDVVPQSHPQPALITPSVE